MLENLLFILLLLLTQVQHVISSSVGFLHQLILQCGIKTNMTGLLFSAVKPFCCFFKETNITWKTFIRWNSSTFHFQSLTNTKQHATEGNEKPKILNLFHNKSLKSVACYILPPSLRSSTLNPRTISCLQRSDSGELKTEAADWGCWFLFLKTVWDSHLSSTLCSVT